jgi:hypothetical protein
MVEVKDLQSGDVTAAALRPGVSNALKLRPTGLGSGIDKDRPDHAVYCGWFWSMTINGPMTRSDRVATLEEAKAQFQKSWDAWKAWAKLEEVP